MLMTTQDQLQGYEITEILGIVQGNTVRARHVGHDLMAGLKNVIGGEVSNYTTLMSQARAESIKRMTEHAETLGANAIVAVRFETSDIMQSAAELFVYGTAVIVTRI